MSEVEVETLQKRTRCKRCNVEGPTIDSIFNCSCGYSFSAKEVESAIDKTLELKEKLANFLREMDFDEQRIEKTTNESFVSWLNRSSFQIGKALGHIAGKIISIIAKIFS